MNHLGDTPGGGVALEDLVPQPTKKKGLGPSDPSSLRKISNRPLYEKNIQKLQRHIKSTYGTDMSYEQASGIMRGDPNASKKIGIHMKTMAFQDQEFRQSIEEGGLTGTYRRPGLSKDEPGVRTLEGRQLDLDSQQTNINAANIFGSGRRTFESGDFGLSPESIANYQDPETGQITNQEAFLRAKDQILTKSDTLHYGLTNQEVIALARGEAITTQVTSIAGRGAAVAEEGVEIAREEIAFDEWKLGKVQEHDVAMQLYAQGNAKELAFGWYLPDANNPGELLFVRGTSTLEEHRVEVTRGLTQQGIDEDEAARIARDEITMLSMTGFSAVKTEIDPVTGERTVMLGEDGQPIMEWVHGDNSIRAMDILSREGINALNNTNSITLAQMGIDSREKIDAAIRLWDQQQLEGYKRTLLNGDEVHVYGTQQWNLIGPALRETGFDAVINVGVDENGPIFKSVHITGTLENDLIRMDAAQVDRVEIEQIITDRFVDRDLTAREFDLEVQVLEWEIDEKRRNGYFTVLLDARGNPVVTKPSDMSDEEWARMSNPEKWRRGDKQREWIDGTTQNAEDLQQLADDNNIDLAQVRADIDKKRDRRLHIYQMIYSDVNTTEAQKTRIWESVERELDRTASADLQDDRMTYEQRRDKADRRAQSYNTLFQGAAILGAPFVAGIIDRFITPGPSGKPAVGGEELMAAHLSGKTADAAWWKEQNPDWDDADTEAMAQHFEDNPLFGGANPYLKSTGLFTEAGRIEYKRITDAGATEAEADAYIRGDDNVGEVVDGEWVSPVDNTPPPIGDDEPVNVDFTGDVVTVDGEPVIGDGEPGNFESLVSDVKGLSGRDIISMGMSFSAGYGTAEIVNSDANVFSKALALGPGVGGAVAGGPLTIGAYAAGFMANAIWRSHNQTDPGTKRRYEWSAPVDQRPPGVFDDDTPGTVKLMIDWHADPDKPFVQGDGSNLYDPNTAKPGTVPGVVYWVHQESGQDYQEPLSEYQERTGRQMQSWYGAEAQLYDGLPPELKEKLIEEGFKPTFIFTNSDGSMTFLNRDGDKSVLLEPDEVQDMFGGNNVSTEPNDDGTTGTGVDTDGRGVATASSLLTRAGSVSPLGAARVRTLNEMIGDDRRSRKFLTLLADGLPFTREDIDDVFFADPEAPQGYRYLTAWQHFMHYADPEQNLIVVDDAVSEEIG